MRLAKSAIAMARRVVPTPRTAVPVLVLAGLAAAPASSRAQKNPIALCCGITAVDVKAGIVTAKITANGSVFQFKISDAKTSLSALRVGQAVYANFATHQVWVNPEAPCCTITSGSQTVIGRPG